VQALRLLFRVVAASILGSCSHQEGSHGRGGPTHLPRSTESEPGDASASRALDAGISALSRPAEGAFDEEPVDFSLPTGCPDLYDTKDPCKKLRNMLGARTRMKNRACLIRADSKPPGYHWACSWNSFAKISERSRWGHGIDSDCFADRYSGEGVMCFIEDEQHPDDRTLYFDTTEGELRRCLTGWHEEKLAVTKRFGDRAFSFSKALDGADAGLVTRIQGCRAASAPQTIDEHERSYMRFEIFTEPAR
jgi:hypothetical protein